MASSYYETTLVEANFPVEEVSKLALREGNQKKPIYQIHKWWARRLGSVFRALLLASTLPSTTSHEDFWERFYSKNDLSDLVVLDPFMGGGTTIVEAMKCGASVIGVDIDPVATFITGKEIEHFTPEKLQAAFWALEQEVSQELLQFYKTLDSDKCLRDVTYVFWVDLVRCPKCGLEFEAHPHFTLSRAKSEITVFCRHCHAIKEVPVGAECFECEECGNTTNIHNATVSRGMYTCPNCGTRDRITNLTSDSPLEKRMFAIEYRDTNGQRAYKRAEEFDKGLYLVAEQRLAEKWDQLIFPRHEIPSVGRNDMRPISHGYTRYWQLFNKRQLYCLSLILEKISEISDITTKEYMLLAFSDSLASNNMLCSYAFDYQKLTPLFGLHAYNMITRPVENNVWGGHYGRGSFRKCFDKMMRGKSYSNSPYEMKYTASKTQKIMTGETIRAKMASSASEFWDPNTNALLVNGSSEELHDIPDNSIDLVLTDPPYYDNLSYSELSDFFYVWLQRQLQPRNRTGESTPYQTALFADSNDPKAFAEGITNVFQECARVLKAQGRLIFTFHHRKIAAWMVLLQALRAADLEIVAVFPVRSEGKSGFHSSEGNIKWDAVLVCRSIHGVINEDEPDNFCDSIRQQVAEWDSRLTLQELTLGIADKFSLGYAFGIARLSKYRQVSDEWAEILSSLTYDS